VTFDWTSFLNRHNIEYVTKGHSVSKDNIAIHCPFCGAADEGYHMAISLRGYGWHCWRNPQAHSGKSPIKLICALIDCSVEHAANLVGYKATDIPNDLLAQVRRLTGEVIPMPEPKVLDMPTEFKHLDNELPSSKPYVAYLRKRGFTDDHIAILARPPFDLRYCTMGEWMGRIIFPICEHGKLVTWTGRTIFDVNLRYRTLSQSDALGPISDHLLWYDMLRHTGAETIVMCEGPFDAAKITMLGQPHSVVGTCFFTMVPSRRQVGLLHELLPKFRRRILLLDQDTFPKSQRLLWSEFAHLDVERRALPTGIKDPGEIRNENRLLKILR
jgi:hypothetical protein